MMYFCVMVRYTILIRFHNGREKQLLEAVKSIINNGYSLELIDVIIHASNDYEYDYIMKYYSLGSLNIKCILNKDYTNKELCFYNLYCNALMNEVSEGWFFFLDSDDTLIKGSLEKISEHLVDENKAVICQFNRGVRVKPSDEMMDKGLIVSGKIGMPCIILNSKHKGIAKFSNLCDSDFHFIKEVSNKLETIFIKIPLVQSNKRNYGK